MISRTRPSSVSTASPHVVMSNSFSAGSASRARREQVLEEAARLQEELDVQLDGDAHELRRRLVGLRRAGAVAVAACSVRPRMGLSVPLALAAVALCTSMYPLLPKAAEKAAAMSA